MIRIHVTNTSFRAFPIELRANCIIPELSPDSLPLTPAEVIKSAPHNLMSGKDIVTCSEVFILFALYCVRRTTNGEITPLEIKSSDVLMYYYGAKGDAPIRLRIDGDGEFVDHWPNGFFDERVPLLFD